MAIDTAKKQGARLLELRATTDLARLWGENNRRAIAAEMLSPLFASFEEGSEIADLKDAKTFYPPWPNCALSRKLDAERKPNNARISRLFGKSEQATGKQ